MAPLGSNQYGLRRLTHLTTSILSKTHLTTWYFLAINYLSCKRRMECEHYYNYFLIRFTQTKITLFIFFSNWVSKGKQKCSRVPKSRAIFGGSITLLNFLRLTIMILNYLWYTHNLPYLSSINIWLKKSIWHTVVCAPLDQKLCNPYFFQSRFTTFGTLIEHLGFYYMKSVYFLCTNWIFCLYLSL